MVMFKRSLYVAMGALFVGAGLVHATFTPASGLTVGRAVKADTATTANALTVPSLPTLTSFLGQNRLLLVNDNGVIKQVSTQNLGIVADTARNVSGGPVQLNSTSTINMIGKGAIDTTTSFTTSITYIPPGFSIANAQAFSPSFKAFSFLMEDTSKRIDYDRGGVLGILMNSNIDSNGFPVNPAYIAFFSKNTKNAMMRVGSIRHSVRNGAVVYYGAAAVSEGSDYAEYLERLNHEEPIAKGDVVGVCYGGKITRNLKDSIKVMVVSTEPGVLGNNKGGEDDSFAKVSNPVAFLGQVPVRVLGKVAFGDYIMASGRQDGTAVAVAPDALGLDQVRYVVGQAWESSDQLDEKKVNVAITSQSDVYGAIVKKQQQELVVLKKALAELTARIGALK